MRALFLILALAISLPPAPTKYVTDEAGVIPDDREHALNERLAAFDRETRNQIIVYVGRRPPAGTTIEEMGAEAIRTWAVGQATKDNGAILFLFIDDRQSRIEVGYGLEGTLTDARSKRILVAMREALRAGDHAGAIEAGAGQIIEVIKDPAAGDASDAVTSVTPGALIPLLLALIAIVAVFWFVWRSDDGDSSSSSDRSSDSSSSSSSSDSSFGGGGGSGGGGGASDKW